MIKNLFKIFVVFTWLISGYISYTFAATLQLTKIGSLDLGGKMYTEWWYTGINPTFYGKASPNNPVNITLGQDSFNTTSDANGDWYYSSSLQAGDYEVSFSQGSERINFKLHLGQNMPGNSAIPVQQSTTPDTGHDQMVALALGAGILLLATYFYIIGDPRRKSVFEAKILKED